MVSDRNACEIEVIKLRAENEELKAHVAILENDIALLLSGHENEARTALCRVYALAPREAAIVEVLMDGKSWSASTILSKILGADYECGHGTVSVQLCRIRKKIAPLKVRSRHFQIWLEADVIAEIKTKIGILT